MGSFREYGKKIVALKGTERVTKTMKMVASGYYRKAEILRTAARAYNERLESLSRQLDAKTLVEKPATRAVIIVISANRGMCGGYNGTIARTVAAWRKGDGAKYTEADFYYLGKKAVPLLRGTCPAKETSISQASLPVLSEVVAFAETALKDAGEDADVYVAYSKSVSALQATPLVERLLPFEPVATDKPEPARELLTMPDTAVLVEHLIRQTVLSRIVLAAMESSVAEQAARRLSMENATANINKLMTQYTLLRNSARQSAITQELTEIVSGAESLKG